jgi:hypothetical protein
MTCGSKGGRASSLLEAARALKEASSSCRWMVCRNSAAASAGAGRTIGWAVLMGENSERISAHLRMEIESVGVKRLVSPLTKELTPTDG